MRHLEFLVLVGLLASGCGQPYCDGGGLGISIWNPPEAESYTFVIEFEGESVELACALDDGKPGDCERSVGAWQVRAWVFPPPYPEPGNPYTGSPLGLHIDKGDDFTSYVPQGEIRVVVTSPDVPGFHAEHVFVPDVQGDPERDCQYAVEEWDLAEDPE
jgi:hypothetical protein